MDKETRRKTVLKEIILGYRAVLAERYDYDRINERIELPESFTRERIDVFKDYFLNYLYPPIAKRAELDEAFEQLDNYIKHPEKLFRIIIDSTSLIFKYGRHLPKILTAGITALQSFRKANRFERQLVRAAITSKKKPPFDKEEINELMKTLTRQEIEDFIESSQKLFETLYDRKLVAKIKEIVKHLIEKMKKRPQTYSKAEIRGLEIGAEIINEGDLLFDQMNKEEQKMMFDFIISVEREVLDQIFQGD